METYGVTEWHGDKPVKQHRVVVDPNAVGGRYRQRVSLQGFQSRMLIHTQRWDGEKFLGYRNMDLRFCLNGRISETTRSEFDDLPVVEHTSVWAFYAAINYDHRQARLDGKAMQIKRS